ncbi:MAG TPA: thymidine kinase [Bacteroidales bacterium]|jgi:thymidine kinase|nr:thymidine kinase [Bacteroidales bacterium]HNQ19569.1 thymidine kinase [Bacteroidales bacterium]HNT71125.1 thymidine kinase [Bacteroidales bacterium]HOH94099.1 thymidine kinase [Bacteroidales bacterium]HPM40245.1 thymidine kinase [Bacteroidales bacterium]
MFLEQKRSNKKIGSIEVIVGSMFSGKTEELIRRIRRAQIANLKVEIYKPAIDKRYDEQQIVSHSALSLMSTPVDNSQSILLLSSEAEVVGIDEAQFFDDELVNVCNTLANNGVRVIVAGLDMDYKGLPFGPIPKLLAIAEHITKVHAVCVKCGDIAQYSFRKAINENLVLLGEKDLYEPLCRACYLDAINNK